MYIRVLLLQQLTITSFLEITTTKQEREEEFRRRGKISA